MKMLGLIHTMGFYTLFEHNIINLFNIAIQARFKSEKLDKMLADAKIEKKLIDCMIEDELWLYKNLEAIANGDSSRPIIKVPTEWRNVVNEAWERVEYCCRTQRKHNFLTIEEQEAIKKFNLGLNNEKQKIFEEMSGKPFTLSNFLDILCEKLAVLAVDLEKVFGEEMTRKLIFNKLEEVAKSMKNL